MPVLVALFIRSLIQMAVTLGAISLAERILLPMLNKAIELVIRAFGVSEETAKDIVANQILHAIEVLGIGVLTLQVKLPTKIAERLGFTSKGFGRRTIPATAPAAARATAAVGTTVTRQQLEQAIVSLAQAATRGGVSQTVIQRIGSVMLKTADRGFLYTLVAAQVLDFGNWNNGAYQKTMQKVLETITFGLIKPDEDWRTSRTVSEEVFDKVWSAYKLQGAVGINDPFKNMSVEFTRENFLDLLDAVGAQLLLQNQNVSTKDVIANTQYAIVFAAGALPAAGPSATGVVETTRVTSPAKATTGSVIQGALGTKVETPIPEAGLIVSTDQLRTAARNALAQFLSSIPGRIIYDVKLVTSLVDDSGFRRYATAKSVQVGTNEDGTPRMRTLLNRIAVIDIYALSDKGQRTKIDQIVLGPTDAFKLTTGVTEIGAIEQDIKTQITTAPLAPAVLGVAIAAQPVPIKVGDRMDLTNEAGRVLGYKEVTSIVDQGDGIKIVTLGRDVDLTGQNILQGGEQYKILTPAGFADFRGAPVGFNLKTAPAWAVPQSGVQAARGYIASGSPA